MILFVAVDFKQVSVLGRNFPWQKPALCPCCKQSHLCVWGGHGFVDTYFEGYPAALPMRRYRCPACGCVIKCRPQGYFARFQTAIATIEPELDILQKQKWPITCTVGPGLEGAIACESMIGYVNGAKGWLICPTEGMIFSPFVAIQHLKKPPISLFLAKLFLRGP